MYIVYIVFSIVTVNLSLSHQFFIYVHYEELILICNY